ncbi:MAG: M23 family metallopeptidase [Spirochaetaceae bacterium]|nr:M23 family metallopeptidase [Spirochaetaceae bacterium]
MGGADVTPQPEMGIEVPELYYTVYRIKPGDMISTLAEDNHITQDTLISVNNIKQSRTIQIGQYIRIPSMAGIVYTTKTAEETPESIAEKYKVSAAKVAQVNQTELGTVFDSGTTLFVPDAELDWITRQEINGDLFTRPLRRSYYISSRFSWRVNPFTGRRTFHNGIDMAAPQGTPIYAALGGTVVATGWDNVYGKYVTVAHHSGYKTLYGHMSKITTKKGAHVTTSTKLGEVGSTGQSTGPHLHFTVYKNGSPINPANVWN